jgi:type IV pilus assembly protein PilA
MSEPIAAVAACKTSVAEYYSTKGSMPGTTNAGCQDTTTQFMSSLSVAAGVIAAATQNTGAGTCGLTLTPSGLSSNSIATWIGTSDCSAKYVPSNFR